ncbi:rod shape-determining protein MreC [Saccharicrinis aurantiacus]|uniref:rod shape-determining protein MreC n=1 Tax=Saccharicrinis aurantiacus TaxID=1849719 RepID=UPI000838DE9B|nr:rod shape-determining protein MreC [Saccharicrinis aurantiacus]
MRSILHFIIKYHLGFLFIFLEIIAFSLIVTFNQNQRALFLSSSSKISGDLFETTSNIEQYLALKTINEELANENAYLRSQMIKSFKQSKDYFTLLGDSSTTTQYKYRAASVVNNSTKHTFNYITINKGTDDGIKPDMGIISPRGIVGIIIKCSKNYSTGLSLLNPRLKISAKLQESDFFGSISWDNKTANTVILEEIPEHASVSLGDKVITSGYSSIFPEGILIGTVDGVEHPIGESFYKISVKLSVDFSKLSFVEVIENVFQEEKIKLEEESRR